MNPIKTLGMSQPCSAPLVWTLGWTKTVVLQEEFSEMPSPPGRRTSSCSEAWLYSLVEGSFGGWFWAEIAQMAYMWMLI